MAEVEHQETEESARPPLPPRTSSLPGADTQPIPVSLQALNGDPINLELFQPPPRRTVPSQPAEEPPEAYDADQPRRLTAFIIPFPSPQSKSNGDENLSRFLIYTPPRPPFCRKPSKENGEKSELLVHRIRRYWLNELREAKMKIPPPGKQAKLWRRAKWKSTRGVDWGINKTKSSNLEFLSRVARMQELADEKAEDVYHKTTSPEEIVLLYPPGMKMNEEQMKEEFLATLLRTKKKAVRDTAIAAALFPVGLTIDTFAAVVWPFGGLAEIDGVWLYVSARGVNTSRKVTKRLMDKEGKDSLRLTFRAESGVEVLERYLVDRCRQQDAWRCGWGMSGGAPPYKVPPTESQVLQAIGWSHTESLEDGKELSTEDERWELKQVKEDIVRTFDKGAREWVRWCKQTEKDAAKAAKTA